ncbi:PREDICTED: QWRF motif-containing protein 2-like isoform X2 [Tarenaya hassleriana]|uniref:QWRF motif-containing protein 2-like isoform X2 n=1 Tax=Tarenaya hassleriana TaxID=28532 RepID=UPI00053C4CC4|nr:PREDICTED: QWRF motif-containing protein 2-like isoform X2 [Tarenaya hassleriana]
MVAAFPQAAIASPEPRNIPRDQQEKPRPIANNGGNQQQRRPRGKQVPSRYLSPSPSSSLSASTNATTTTSSSSSSSFKTSKRYPSPLLSRPTNSASTLIKTPSLLPKRSQSVDRRRPSPAPVVGGSGAEMSVATKMLITSTRSLSVSFQGEAFSLPISKKKETTPLVSHRKTTPERRRSTPVRDQRENSKPVDQLRWPGTSRKGNNESESNPLSRSLDCGSDRRKLGSGYVGNSLLHHSLVDGSPRVSVDGRLSLNLGSTNDLLEMRNESKRSAETHSANALASSISCDFTASDTDSVSSGSTNGVQECDSGGTVCVNGEISKMKSLRRSIMASARFWQETNSRLRRLQDPSSPLPSSPSSRTNSISSKFGQLKGFSSDGNLPSPRSMPSPTRGATRPASPSKLWATTTSSPARAISSPARVRNGVSDQMNSCYSDTPSILCFSADIRRGKIGEDRVMDAHLLRLLYNRYLQWRFGNARADSIFMVQRLNAEKILWHAWISISELRHTVTLKRIKLLLLKQKLKLASILRGQVGYMEEWSLLERDHSNSLSEAIGALKASTLRLPIVGKAVADIRDLKHAVSSAVVVMQAMASSICSLSMKVDETNSVMVELVNITAKEKGLLEQCQGFLSRVAALQKTRTLTFTPQPFPRILTVLFSIEPRLQEEKFQEKEQEEKGKDGCCL